MPWFPVALLFIRLLSPVDLFSEPEQAKIREKVRQSCEAVDRQSIDRKWVDAIRVLPAESDGKQAYVSFLKERYDYTITRLNEAYGLDFQSFTDITSFDFKTLDRGRPVVQKDDEAFLEAMREIVERLSQEGLKSCRH